MKNHVKFKKTMRQSILSFINFKCVFKTLTEVKFFIAKLQLS